ncbi:unnamed protein product [Tilletia controversa]|uniref:Uncharacterized protein n=3 Tax=Tilletia TaxID=13289 RepID=A0A8X7MPQ8_9BASI|nr:hypothetical protein CF336_g5747 [Tilletia laevis]KAE8190498.1 hypothetical protein CF328_g5956 [Tilletia controversa]KAE8256863.1 hypothetical protein A4X03_0g4980 [Tilletia caries]KAE8195550.1 hypothetical protein CF335_g5074 [Tilletia laevis]KAE8243617.1 hypothetical protein A4X06_0g6195 [Tilletia controversa]
MTAATTNTRPRTSSASSASRRVSAAQDDETAAGISSQQLTPSRSTAASIYAPTPLRAAALKPRTSIPTPRRSLLVRPTPNISTSSRPSSNPSTTHTEHHNDNDDDDDGAQWAEEDETNQDSAPIASRTRRRNTHMYNNNNNPNRRSLLAPPTSSLRRPSSALGKRRAERRDDDSDFEDEQQQQQQEPAHEQAGSHTSEFGVRRSGIPPPTMNLTPPSAPTAAASSSRLARPSGTSPTKAGALLNSLRAASPLKSVAARQLGSYLTGAGVGGSGVSSGIGGTKGRVRNSLGSLGAFHSAVARKSGLRPPGAGPSGGDGTNPDTSGSSSLGGGGALGSLPRPRKLSRPSTAGEVQYVRATLGAAAGGPGVSSGLPKPRMGSSSSLGPAAANKRQSLQIGAPPPDSFAKVVGPSSSHQPQAANTSTSSSSSSAAASSKALPPSTSTFKFAMPSSKGAGPTASGRVANVLIGTTPLRQNQGPVHPAVASLRPPQQQQQQQQGGNNLSRMLLPTPDARERGKKRLSGMSLGSNTSMGAVLAASSSSSSSFKIEEGEGEDKENQKVGGKGKAVEGEGQGEGGDKEVQERAMSPTMKDWHILNQLQNLAQQSGLSLEHIRNLLTEGPSNIAAAAGSDRAVLAATAQTGRSQAQAQGQGRSLLAPSNSTSSRSLLAPAAPVQSTPSSLRRRLPTKPSAATAAGMTMSPSSDTSMALGMGASAIGEETIDLVNLSLSPPGSIGSPLAGPDESLIASLGCGDFSMLGDGSGKRKGEGEEEEEVEEGLEELEGESDLEVESPLMAIVALRSDQSVKNGSSPSGTGGADSTRDVRLVAGPLPDRSLRARGGRGSSSISGGVDLDLRRELDSTNLLGILSSPSSSSLVSEQILAQSVSRRGGKSSTDSEGTARGLGTAAAAAAAAVEQAAEVVRLKAELEQARLDAARQRDLHELKLAEYEEALTVIRDEQAATPKTKTKDDADADADADVTPQDHDVKAGSDSKSGKEEDEERRLQSLQARIEAMQTEQARARKLYESELAGLEEACRLATERASLAEAERTREQAQAVERARLDEEARHALGEEAERAMVALVEEREQAKEAEGRLRISLEELEAASGEREQAGQEEVEAERAGAVEREGRLRRELEVQEGVVVDALGTRRRVLGECAARAWGDLVDLGRNEMLLLDGKADMCHFLLAQLELWDGLVSSCYPSGTLSGVRDPPAGQQL